MKVLLIELPTARPSMPSMSLASLKSYVNEKTEHSAKILDLSFRKNKYEKILKEKIRNENPDLIGLSIFSFNCQQALNMASFIKENFNVKILFGGVHTILDPEDVIKHKQVDFVCTGEGELVLRDLLNSNLNGKNIEGVWYREGEEIIRNPRRELIQDLDNLPFPDWDDFELKKYFLVFNNHLPIYASRGCPYGCTYCSNHALKQKLKGKYVRAKSADRVLEEVELRIKQYYKKGLRYFFFYDDTFIMDRNFILEFCKKYKEKQYYKLVKYSVNVRANLVTEEIIKTLKESGCYEVRMGIESGNDYIRNKLYKRNMSEEQIFNAINLFRKYNLRFKVQFIIGAPYETVEMMEQTLEMAKKVNADSELFPVLMPLPSTEMKEICEKEGLIEQVGFDDAQNMYTSPVIKTKFASRKQVQKIVKKVRMYQTKKYLRQGLKAAGPLFLWDLLTFLVYYKPKYNLEIDSVYRFTLGKYNLLR